MDNTKGNTNCFKEMKNDGRVNVVGRISDDERFLLNFETMVKF